MSSRVREEEDPWDFTPVLNLVNSLSIGSEDLSTLEEYTLRDRKVELLNGVRRENGLEHKGHLGDFGKIWQYLGQPLDVPPPVIPSEPTVKVVEVSENHASTSEEQARAKAVKWRDELEGAGLADIDEGNDAEDALGLTKTQRKRARRRRRRTALESRLTNGTSYLSGSDDESETGSPTANKSKATKTPDSRRVIHEILHGSAPTPSKSVTAVSLVRSEKVGKTETPIHLGKRPVATPQSTKFVCETIKSPKQSAYAAAAAKKATLIALLHETFIDDRAYLTTISYINHVNGKSDAAGDGIHVFVDASNITIGFHDALKLARGQAKTFRMRRHPLSFHSLSLILERGRPTAKRIVVGSDNFPAMQEAKAIGYETSILDRVHKAKELTPRQIKFQSNGAGGTGGGGTGTGSGSETTATTTVVQYAPEKWVEQAVDEILHLKMMESVVDAAEPATMVLATGDAAEAEYSGGFLKMVERALGKGWRVELASFRHNTSWAYKRRDFRVKWGERFRMVELDDFVELLLGEG